MKRLVRNLLEKSEEAFVLALEIFNKPTIRYRIEGFCFFYINAWELLLKARLTHTTGKEVSIYYETQKGQPRRSLSLRDALGKAILDQTDPVRRNVEEIAGLRDQATHLLIPELEAVYSGLFQAGVLNYVNYLQKWFGRNIQERSTPPLLSLVWDLKDLQPKVVRRRYGVEALKFLQENRERIQQLESGIADRQFSISIDYKLVLTKKPGDADITLGTGPGGAIAGQIIQVPKDVSLTHPFTQKTAVQEIVKRLGGNIRFTTYDFQAILDDEGVKKTDSSPLHYLLKHTNTHCYSDKLVDEIVSKVKADSGYLNRRRASYKQRHPRTKHARA